MTSLVILGLDAADYKLLKRWDCENILLEHHDRLQTDTFSLDVPATLEVWPSIATGLHPSDHGVTVDPSKRQGRSRPHRFISRIVNYAPPTVRDKVLDMKNKAVPSSFPVTNAPHMFEQGTVSNWPGITPCHDWRRGIKWFQDINDGNLSEDEFRRREFGNAGKGFGWLRSQVLTDVPITGRHIHILDTMGHVYGKRPTSLQKAYTAVDQLVGELRQVVDRLVIISDHGMQTSELEDENPGVHSERAFISSTLTADLPETIYEVKPWVEKEINGKQELSEQSSVDAPIKHLQDLGYLD